ncbi:MAG: guanylate kinase, partial [Acidobacteria bacterium]
SLYGTSAGPARRILESGRDLLLDIDVQGAAQVRRRLPEAVTIFILPPDFETLRQRLVARGMDPPAQLERRLAAARAEAGEFRRYDYVVVNHDLDQAAEEVRSVVISERRRTSRMEEAAQEILATFEEANT